MAFAPARAYQRLLWLALGTVLLPLLLAVLPPAIQWERVALTTRDSPAAPASVAPTNQTLPPGLGPVLNATLAADSGEDYAITPLASSTDGLRADNPAQRFAATFDMDGVRVAPASGAAFSMRATEIITANGVIAVAAAQPTVAGSRVEYRRDGMTEWYVNGPRGVEQGFTLAAPPAGADQFTVSLAVTGDLSAQADNALAIGDLRYSGLTVTDAAGVTLPAHLDLADGTIQIAVNAAGAQWPVTVDPTITSAAISADDHAAQDLFGQSVATTTLNGTTYVVVGAPQKTVGGNAYQGEAYVFAGSAGTYNQRARLTAPDGAANNGFGASVAITPSADGTTVTIAIGACANSGCANKAYVFTGSGTVYPQQAILSTPRSGTSNPAGFGRGIAVGITDGGKTTVAVGAPDSAYYIGSGQFSLGGVYLFAGSGTSYAYLTELVDPASNGGAKIGASVAFVSNNGTNTVVAGAPGVQVGGAYQGGVYIFTGSDTTYSSVLQTVTDGAGGDSFGQSVALAIAHGVNTIVVGAPGKAADANGAGGAAYVLIGSDSTYTTTRLHDTGDQPVGNSFFGSSVAIGFAGGNRLIAVGALQQIVTQFVGAGVVVLFTQSSGSTTYTQSSLSEPPGGDRSSDAYGSSVALTAAVNGDTTVIGGATEGTSTQGGMTNRSGTAIASYWRVAPAVVDIQAAIGDHWSTTASSSPTAFDGPGLSLVAKVFAPVYGATVPVGVTFTFDSAGAAHGVFDRSNPGLAAVHVMTQSATDPGFDGNTPEVSVYPSGTVGTFNVTATVDDLPLLTATFHLTIVASVPAPVLGRVVNGHRIPAFSSVYIPVSPPTDPYIVVSGSGFTRLSTVYLDCGHVTPTSPPAQPQRTGFANDNTLAVYLDHTALTTAGSYELCVVNPPGQPGGTDGGRSLASEIVVLAPMPAPSTDTVKPVGNTHVSLGSGGAAVLLGSLAQSNGASPLGPASGGGVGLASAGNGIIASGGGNFVASGGGNFVASGGGNIVASGGGNISPASAVQTQHTSAAQTGATPPASTTANVAPLTASTAPYAGDYTARTDSNGLFLSPPITSNGIPGTYTRTIAIDGVSAPVTYTITNLDPHDGHPAVITSLSRTGASAGSPDFPLTVTGTGFVSGSALSFGGVQLTTTPISATQVSATVPAALLKSAAPLDVVVVNPDTAGAADGGGSLPTTFTVTPPAALLSLTPADISPGSQQFTLKVTGTNFVTGATVKWNGTALTTAYVSPTTLTATVPGSLVAAAGTAQVTVTDPLGVATTALTFTITVVKPEPPPRPGVPPVQPVPGVQPAPAGRPVPPGAGTGSLPNPIPTGR